MEALPPWQGLVQAQKRNSRRDARVAKQRGHAPAKGRVATALLLTILLGCAELDLKVFEAPGARSGDAPREFVLLCRPQVLRLDDGTRSPGVVAQVFLMGGDDLAPIAVPSGEFTFRAFDARSEGEIQSWTFSDSEVEKHHIDHSLGPCYAFWLPIKPSKAPVRQLVVYGRFALDGQEVGSKPVRVAVPGR